MPDIDAAQFEKHFPAKLRRKVTRRIWDIVDEHEGQINDTFFGALHTYHHRPIQPDRLGYPDLFSPNICALDFAMKHLSPATDVILDYGCGMGICGSYLRQLGFTVYGYDNWTQIPKNAAFAFQAMSDHPIEFVDDFRTVEPTVVMHVSIWCKEREAWDRPCVRRVMSDSHYVPNSFDGPAPGGFSIEAQYGKWLTVFKRGR